MKTPFEVAMDYLALGWAPIPILHKSKKPIGTEWQVRRITEADAGQWFNGEEMNVGVRLGDVSGWLADADLDCSEAIAGASFFLTRTRTFGRASKRCSHWLYKTRLAESEDAATIKFMDVQKPAKVILEIRIGGGGSGAQTVFPGSVHPSGEAIEWEDEREVTEVDGEELRCAGARLSSCVLLARAYPDQGGRHEGANVIAGFLCRCGFSGTDIKLFVDALASVTCQPPDKRKDMVRVAGDAAEAFTAGRNTYGLPKMVEVFGEPIVKKCVAWLGYKAEARGAAGARAADARGADGFARGDAGQILKGHPQNIRVAVELLGIYLKFNSFSSQTDISGLDGYGPYLDDTGAARLRLLIHETYGFLPSQDLYDQVIGDIAHQNKYHPVLEYLGALVWDGVSRLRGWLAHYLGADQTHYSEEIGKAFFLSLVARIFIPGCKQDYMLILEGPQGAQKSMACEIISGKWFSDNLPDVRDHKDVSQHLKGKWLIEVSELSAMGRAETSTLKAFITRTTERYRPSYGRLEVIQPRQCVFVGTTNVSVLKDSTGGRRFWPLKVGLMNLEALRNDRDQLFAEAVHLFKSGAKWWPERDFEITFIKPEQDIRMMTDPWCEPVGVYLKNKDKVTVYMVAREALGMEGVRIDMRSCYRISEALTLLGWEKKKSHGVGWYTKSEV